MFGPDKCRSTDKVHFILQHKNPKTGKFVDHHLKFAPSVPYDKLSHVYTAILKPGNELQILVDGEEKRKANFLSADYFEPAFIPPKTIPDPDDKKAEDWDERDKISDSDAVKPDDWDEDAPMEIEDAEACEAAPGCGEWKRPMKRNPEYKGKWHSPLIDNPNYKGIWKTQEIDNPDYFELDKPDFEPITAIGIEIWTMQDGILFDNILIASDEKMFAASASSDVLSDCQKKVFDVLYKVADIPFLEAYKNQIIGVIEKAEKQPILTIGVLVSIVVVVATAILRLLFGRKKPQVSCNVGETDAPGNSEENEKNDASAPHPRRSRRET
ncbi:unnamed protein product [Musa textilis]